jgi:pimeloyl-ACP methyl ester carboxylesterase
MHVVTDPWTAAATATFVPGMAGGLDPDDPVDKLILGRMDEFTREGSGYLAIQNSRPQTIGYGLVDSPILQLAWIAEKVHEWTGLPVDRDQLLTTVSLYWFTGCGTSVAHTLYEQAHATDWAAPPAVPQGFAVFGADDTVRKLLPPPAGAHWSEFPHGRHFPAMEAPTELASDLQAFFGPLR